MDWRRYSLGTWVSGIGHTGLILWLIFGWGLDSDPLDFEITNVAVISSEQYNALVAASSPTAAETPTEITAPATEATPEPTPAPEPAPTVAQPETPATPVAETQPTPAARPEPPAEVPTDVPPTPVMPEPQSSGAPDLPPSDKPVPRPADRITETPNAPPPPDAVVAVDATPAVSQDSEGPAAEVPVETQPTAPAESADRIVTEADKPAGGLTTSPRPAMRPPVPPAAEPKPEPTPEPTPAPTETQPETPQEDAVAAALAAAAASSATPAPAATAGPPLTGGETEGFRLSINQCWNFDPGSLAAEIVVTVGFELDQSGKVINNDVWLVDSRGGDGAFAQSAFEAARRAVLRCQGNGYPLPPEKYDQWREVNVIFDSSGVRF